MAEPERNLTRSPADPTDPRERVLDEWLVLSAQSGDQGALNQLLARWRSAWIRHAARITGDHDLALDAVQDASLAMARSIRRLHDPARFRGWSYRLVTNKSTDIIRKRQRDRRLMRNVADAGAARDDTGTANPAAPAEAHEDQQRVRSAVAALPVEQRIVVELHYGDGLTVREIGQALGIAPGTVKSRLHHSRNTLRTALEERQEVHHDEPR